MLPTPPQSPRPNGSCVPEERLGLVLAGRIQLISILGVGAYGTVYKAQDLETNAPYAVKALNKIGLDPRQRRFQEREIQLHYQASQHANVVSLVKIMDTSDCTFVVIEFCPEGDLFAKITEEGHYVGNDFLAKHVFLQIVDAVAYCHSIGIYHRDLKPENILVTDSGNTVKLADFGLATQDPFTSDFGCGSTFYMSPECQQPNPKPSAWYASAPNDVWSLGVILVNLVCGRNPWKRSCPSDATFRAFKKDPAFLRSILPISPELNCILERIFEMDPRKRIGLEELHEMILRCPRFTMNSAPCTAPSTPQFSPVQNAMD
ncbi:kinase-like protein, partial [Polychaeton citri CBS 116435]